MTSLSLIVSQTLIQNQINDKTYENAMLRCLGWTQHYIVAITFIKSFMFFILPAAVTGLLVAYFIIVNAKQAIEAKSGGQIILNFTTESTLVGLGTAVVLPILAMILPIINGLSIQLRDALDIFRNKIETVTVAFTRLESMYGLSISQLILGLILSVLGVIIYVMVPFSILTNEYTNATGYLLSIYVVCSIASCVIVKMCIPSLSTYLIELYAWVSEKVFGYNKPNRLKTIVYKNMRAHYSQNQKIGLIFIGTIAFLMLITTLTKGIAEIMIITYQRLLGSDFSVITQLIDMEVDGKEERPEYVLNKQKMTDQMKSFMETNAYVKSFAFTSFSLESILMDFRLQADNED